MTATPAALRAEVERLNDENFMLRKEWWLNHRCVYETNGACLYGDDGELQCGQCGCDFKREPFTDIVLRQIARTVAALAPPAEGPGR